MLGFISSGRGRIIWWYAANRRSNLARTEHRVAPGHTGCATMSRTDAPYFHNVNESSLRSLLLVIGTTLFILAWLAMIYLVDSARFIVIAPRAKTGFEVFLALGQLFGALILAIVPDERIHHRLRWAASGLLISGLGALGYGYLYPLVNDTGSLNTAIFGSLLVRTLATGLIAIGMFPARPPQFRRATLMAVLILAGMLGMIVALRDNQLPTLIDIAGIHAMETGSPTTLPGLTPWHWTLAPLPLILGIVATVGALRHFPGHALGGWLAGAVVLLTGSQLHSIFWPSLYSSVLTTTSFLRLGFTLVLVGGGILELRHLMQERAAMLAVEQERTRRLEELAVLKSDFTAIVAHELASPLAAIGALTEIVAIEDLSTAERCQAVAAIQAETRMLHTLVADVQAAAAVERDDFAVQPHPVPVSSLLEAAAAYARTLAGAHPLTVENEVDTHVMVDPERVGQVLRNLLNNATKHTPPGTPVALRALRNEGHIRIDVIDKGPGITPADQHRIFQKYARGLDGDHRQVPGRGLGLYFSRRVLQMHGSTLTVASEPGQGAVFSFRLREVR